MYNTAAIIFITSCIILSVQSKAVIDKGENKQKSINDKLLELSNLKCPYLKTTKLLEASLTASDICPDYDTVSAITSLNRKTLYGIPCLLYYNSFAILCHTVTNINLTNVITNETVDGALKSYNIANTCVNLKDFQLVSEFKNSTELIKNVTTKPNLCERICSGLLDNTVTPICSLAAYSVNITRKIQKALAIQNAVKKDSSDTKVQPVQPIMKKPIFTNSAPTKLDKETEVETDIQAEHIPQPQVNDKSEAKVVPQEKKTDTPLLPNQEGIRQNTSTNANIKKIDLKNSSTIPLENTVNNVNQNQIKHDVEIDDANRKDQQDEEEEEVNDNQQVDAPNSNQDNFNNKDAKVAESNNNKLPSENENNPVPDKSVPIVPDSNNPVETGDEMLGREELPIDDIPNDGNGDDEIPPETASASMKQVTEQKSDKVKVNTKPQETDEDVMPPAYTNSNTDDEDSFFFIYFMMVCAVFILGYIGYHNKQKVLALVIEGRRGRRGSRRGRPNSANYHKLDSNLEEAVTSSCNKNTTNIIY